MSKKSMYLEKNRLKTFDNWPLKECKCSPIKMAEAGWYACDENQDDLAQCFLCDKQLDGWEPDDDPWNEHRKHSAKCMFAQLGKKDSQITIKDHFNLCFEIDKKRLIKRAEELREELVEQKRNFMKLHFPKEKKWH